MDINPWNINIRTEKFQKYSPYILFKVKHIYDKNVTYYKFDFLPVFIFVKTRGVGQNFNQLFYNFLHENDTQVFTTEDQFEKR